MEEKIVQIQLTQAEALVLFEWLARSDEVALIPTQHPSEQKVLWILEGKLEKELAVFSTKYREQIEEARKQVDEDNG